VNDAAIAAVAFMKFNRGERRSDYDEMEGG
jgi:hypothetical protein